VKTQLKQWLGANANEEGRQAWLTSTLRALPSGLRILDAGAGELRNKPLCANLTYVSQDICQYEGRGDATGLHTGTWDTSRVDLVCDITSIPEPDHSFDAILCSEVFEHLADPLAALDEFARLLKPGGKLIISAPFSSLVHFAPYHFATGFSRYWYELNLPARHFKLAELTANGDWFALLKQELLRLPKLARGHGARLWPLAYLLAGLGMVCMALLRPQRSANDLACFGWHCVAVKQR
jgi:SAM-dependent methyltransferase